MADQIRLKPLVQEALPHGDGNFPAQLYVLTFAGAVHGTVADCQRVHPGAADELHRAQGIGVGGTLGAHIILRACQHAQLSLHSYAQRVSVFDHFPGQFHVLLQGQAASIDHHGGIAAVYGSLHAFKVAAVIQMQGDGDRALLAEPPDCSRNILCTGNLVLNRSVYEIGSPAHEGVGQIGSLQNRGAAELLMRLDNGLCLTHGVDVESALRIAGGAVGGFQYGAKRNQRHRAALLSSVRRRIRHPRLRWSWKR